LKADELLINLGTQFPKITGMITNQVNYSTVENPLPTFLVIDNFYKDPDSVRNYALTRKFRYNPESHKGQRTEETYRFDLKEKFEQILQRKIRNWEYYAHNGCFQICVAGNTLVYHFDHQQYASVLFLCPDAPPNTGTTFYRSKFTNKMKVEQSEHDIVFRNGFLDSTDFEVVDVVGNVYNRLVLFDAKLIHAASCYFGTNINNGRLFQIFFFDIL
jgi:hypothetical protein